MFEIALPPGYKEGEFFYSFRQIAAGSPAPTGTMIDEVVEAIPSQYNAKSTQRFDAKEGKNPKDFELSTK